MNPSKCLSQLYGKPELEHPRMNAVFLFNTLNNSLEFTLKKLSYVHSILKETTKIFTAALFVIAQFRKHLNRH